MSLPKSASPPPLSSSPSKQSPQHPSSRPHSIIDQPATAQQTTTNKPTPEETPTHHHEPFANIDSHLAEYERHHESQSESQSLFQPFFTLIEDAHAAEYYHPTVHYIFSDDDSDIITEAALRTLEAEQYSFPQSIKGKTRSARDHNHRSEEGDGEEDAYDEEGGYSGARKESLLPEPVPGVRENYIILDLDHLPLDGGVRGGSPSLESQGQNPPQQPEQEASPPPPHQFTITSAHSLSPTWQVLNTQLMPAPTFENNASGEKSLNGGHMLQIKGTSGLPMNMLGKEKDRGGQRLEDMMGQFAKRLDELKQVIESGEQGMAIHGGDALREQDLLGDPDSGNAPGGPTETREPRAYLEDDTVGKEQKTTESEESGHAGECFL